jgi:dTDP-4-dehydrorhamnose reductase
MLRLGGQGKPLRVVADQVCTPSCTLDVAETTVALLERGARGLFHVVNSGSCSWYDLARAIFELSNLAVEVTPITTAEYGAPARRPAYSVLSVDSLPRLGLPAPRPWREALQRYLSLRPEHRGGA